MVCGTNKFIIMIIYEIVMHLSGTKKEIEAALKHLHEKSPKNLRVQSHRILTDKEVEKYKK